MSIAIAQTRHMFGLKPGVSGNICYHDEQTIVYPAGSNCILYNIDQKSQKFIPGILYYINIIIIINNLNVKHIEHHWKCTI